MNDRALLSARVAECNANSGCLQDAPQVVSTESSDGDSSCGTDDACLVGEDRVSHMSDTEREDAIVRAGKAIEAWYSRYQASGDPRALDIAYRMLGNQKALIEGRSAAFVARLEAERGLR